MAENTNQKTDWLEVAAFSLGIISFGLSVYLWMNFPAHALILLSLLGGLMSMVLNQNAKYRKGYGRAGAILGGMGILLRVIAYILAHVAADRV